MMTSFRIIAALMLALLCFDNARAQSTLPQIDGMTKDGINILSWMNPYQNGIKSIAVQRSNDSTYNFATIGYIEQIRSGRESYIDGHPLPGTNWYRLQIIFSSDIEWKSNLVSVYVDSSAIANRKPLPTNDSLQKLVSRMGPSVNPVTELPSVTYPKSKYVFTNPFTGNINIEIPDALKHLYSIKFFNQDKEEVLEIPRVDDSVVILDKRNFQHSGVFRFKVFKDKEEFEKGYITIY